jgi:hypothetical protein
LVLDDLPRQRRVGPFRLVTVIARGLIGDRRGQSKETYCDTQEKREARQGEHKAFAQKGGKGSNAEKEVAEDCSKDVAKKSAKTRRSSKTP